MKHKNNYRYLLMGLMMAMVSSAVMLSCKDDDPSLAELRDDKIQYLADSLRVSDSLRRLNQAGVVNYAITVVSGSTSSLFKNSSRTDGAADVVAAALVTISQFGKVVTDTTDASGMVVLNGFFRGAVNVTVRKENFTTASFVTAVKFQDDTENGTINFVGNLIPIFETTGANTATISGVARIQSDLTNTTMEPVPAGTTLMAHVDVTDGNFIDRFLSAEPLVDDTGADVVVLNGVILEAAYSTGVIGTTAADGTYSVIIPAAIDGLPIVLEYSSIAVNRLRFDDVNDVNSSNRTISERTIYAPGLGATVIPNPSSATLVNFNAGSGAIATAEISPAGTVENVTVTEGGSNWTGTPTIALTGGGGTGALATATITNGVLTGITVTNKGTGYTSQPTVEIHSGSGAAGAVGGLNTNGTVTGVVLTNTGSGYTVAPTVTFSGGGTPTTPAAATANISGGRVTSITVTNPGAGYTSPPTASLTGGTTTGTAATVQAASLFSGLSIGPVSLTNPGSGYSFAPAVLFDAPTTAGGTRATGTVSFDPVSGQVTAIQVTNAGSGYTSTPGLTIYTQLGGTPAATAFLTGSGVTGLNLTNQGTGYVGAPKVVFTGGGGTGATATAVVNNGRVVAINIVTPGAGYTTIPAVSFIAGSGATGVIQIGANGAITNVRITTNGSGYVGAPTVTFTTAGAGRGDGATGTATIANEQVTGVNVTAGGSGYLLGNTPNGTGIAFSATSSMQVKPGVKYINDVSYGSGQVQPQ
ncbi:MAG TPA: hypothetical protein VK508_04810 [Cyclobacteriaceae bacterium]|nr:hypothetical protein [Cyclobacteriaceae bacterium]